MPEMHQPKGAEELTDGGPAAAATPERAPAIDIVSKLSGPSYRWWSKSKKQWVEKFAYQAYESLRFCGRGPSPWNASISWLGLGFPEQRR